MEETSRNTQPFAGIAETISSGLTDPHYKFAALATLRSTLDRIAAALAYRFRDQSPQYDRISQTLRFQSGARGYLGLDDGLPEGPK